MPCCPVLFLLISIGLAGCAADGEAVDGIDIAWPWGATDPFADDIVSVDLGEGSGFGQADLPHIVLGAPEGAGANAGGVDVLSLGRGGSIVLEFIDILIEDGPGDDLLVFENAFPGWLELGIVAVSEDGETWHEWSCDLEDAAGGYPGCAGVAPVLSSSLNGLDPTDPFEAGGDAYDLSDLTIDIARFIRITDSGVNMYEANSGGFDLDAVAAIHWEGQQGL
jgi:hypothetical protein